MGKDNNHPPVTLPATAGSIVNFDRCAMGIAKWTAGMPFFLPAPCSVETSLIYLIVYPSDRAYHRAVCSDATLFDSHGRLLPAFPLN